MSDNETFTRLYYYGRIQMGMQPEEFWLMPMGLFLDLWACHRQWLGLEKAGRGSATIDDAIPFNC